jgi:Iron-containing redox enzyme
MGESPELPRPRGPLSEFVIDHVREGRPVTSKPPRAVDDPLEGDDSQLALYVCYELHYRSYGAVADELEWDPGLLGFRRQLERRFEDGLRHDVPSDLVAPSDVAARIRRVIDEADGPSMSNVMLTEGTVDHFREFAVHRSAYQLKEADPHTWGIPRLSGRPKAALLYIQADEYGGGFAPDVHSQLFANTMDALGLDSTYGAYIDRLPGLTLATGNLISLFGLHRRWRGALAGHLTVFEMTSVIPMGRYSEALRRLEVPAAARRFYDVHVEADADHEVVALNELAAGLALEEPELAGDIVFGARAVMEVERRFAESLLSSWRNGHSSLIDDGRRSTSGLKALV